MGPMHDSFVDLTKIRDFFPSYHQTKLTVSIKKPSSLEYMTTTLRVFRSAPPTKMNEDYILYPNSMHLSNFWS